MENDASPTVPKLITEVNDSDPTLYVHLDDVEHFNAHKKRFRQTSDGSHKNQEIESVHAYYAKELADVETKWAQRLSSAISDLKKTHQRDRDTLTAECTCTTNAARMAHAGEIQRLRVRIQTLEHTVESQQNELSNHAEADAQMRQVELRTQRLDYVGQFIDKFKSVTKKARLPPPVQSLITDFMSNEMLEDLSTRFLTVGKVAFEMLHYELPIDRLAKVGIYASDKYLEVYAHRPPKYNRFVGGNPVIEVNYYTDTDRWIIEDAIKRERLDNLGVSTNGLNQ